MSKLYQYTPFPPQVKLDKSDIHGFGIFAATEIKYVDFEYKAIVNTHLVFHGNVHREVAGALINHSSEPNCKLWKTGIPHSHEKCKDYYYAGIFPIRDIEAGEELTIDYEKSFSVLGMDCKLNFE